MKVLVMGVSGAGKTTIGRLLAERLECEFIDADEHHPPENVAKMASGIPLDDADRAPWLAALNRLLRERGRVVLACSALKQSYRDRLADGVPGLRVVYLKGGAELIGARLARRRHRYMPASLLGSQFAALEPPANAIEVDVAGDEAGCVALVVSRLGA